MSPTRYSDCQYYLTLVIRFVELFVKNYCFKKEGKMYTSVALSALRFEVVDELIEQNYLVSKMWCFCQITMCFIDMWFKTLRPSSLFLYFIVENNHFSVCIFKWQLLVSGSLVSEQDLLYLPFNLEFYWQQTSLFFNDYFLFSYSFVSGSLIIFIFHI